MIELSNESQVSVLSSFTAVATGTTTITQTVAVPTEADDLTVIVEVGANALSVLTIGVGNLSNGSDAVTVATTPTPGGTDAGAVLLVADVRKIKHKFITIAVTRPTTTVTINSGILIAQVGPKRTDLSGQPGGTYAVAAVDSQP
jgi:hypothetical protein